MAKKAAIKREKVQFGHVSTHQPDSFAFSKESLARIKKIITRYPKGRQQSAVIPALDIAQRQQGWVPVKAMEAIADLLEMPYIRVYEVASFYSMFNLVPTGEHLIQVCRTTSCWLRGSDSLTDTCKKKLNIDIGGTSDDGKFSLIEVECLGACVNAPMVQINDDYYEDLDPKRLEAVLDGLSQGKNIEHGPQITRQCSAPEGMDHA